MAQRVVFRSRICLLAADGLTSRLIAQELHTTRPTVSLWKKRFEELGPMGLIKDAPRGPNSRRIEKGKVKAIVEATLHTSPPDSNRWTTRSMAKIHGVSNATVARIWKAYRLQPHKVEMRKRSSES
jgi:transposase